MKLPDYRERTRPLDIEGLILFGAGLALLSYVLEVFGEHALSAPEILGLLFVSIALLFGYGVHAERTRWPLLRLGLFRIRSFAAAVGGGFFTRLGIGGVPFLLATPLSGGIGILTRAVGPPDHASGRRRDEHEDRDPPGPGALRLFARC